LLVDAEAAITTIPLSTPQYHDTVPATWPCWPVVSSRLVRARAATPKPREGEVKNRDGMAMLETFTAKLASTRSTAATAHQRHPRDLALAAERAARLARDVAVPVRSTRSGRLWSPLSSSTVSIASVAKRTGDLHTGHPAHHDDAPSTCNEKNSWSLIPADPNRSSRAV
jgi:hypothetical protein